MAVDNGSGRAKVAFRLAHMRGRRAGSVLDLFAGEGFLYRQIWSAARFGATCDKDAAKAQRAADERPGWACYAGDAGRLLEYGWMGGVGFDVVDIDAWGSPWPFLRAWATSQRARLTETIVFMTDGYAGQMSLAAPCQTLFPGATERRSITAAEYRDAAEMRLSEWGGPDVLDFGRLRGGAGRMYAWALLYRSAT